jgi:hypothetical protein
MIRLLKNSSGLTAGIVALMLLSGCGGGSGTGETEVPVPAPEVLTPACSTPASLIGRFDARVTGYFVIFNDDVDAAKQTPILAERLGFTPRHIYITVLNGFAAELTPEQIASLRCDPSVKYLEYNVASTTG